MLHRGARVDPIPTPDPAAANGGEQFEKAVGLLERPFQSIFVIHEEIPCLSQNWLSKPPPPYRSPALA
jgi:hypothetical protein